MIGLINLAAQLTDTRPNIVVIVADDLGYADTSSFGSAGISTPNVDQIAGSGVVCQRAYATCSICAPSRAGLLTGMYPERYGFYFNYGDNDGVQSTHDIYGISHDVPTLAERLHDVGYKTGVFGKWHLGYAPGNLPNDRGFDRFWGFLNESDSYFPTDFPSQFPFYSNRQQTQLTEYQSYELADDAVSWIRNQNGRYFCYLPFGAVHTPMEADQDVVRKFRDDFATWPSGQHRRQVMAAMVTEMDTAVGRVLSEIRHRGDYANTLIFFVSDNGGSGAPICASDNAPWAGYKWMMDEGGIRVPMIVSWPAQLQQKHKFAQTVSLMDIAPTVLEAVSAPPQSVTDGVSLIPYLRQLNPKNAIPHQKLYFCLPGNSPKPDQRAVIWNNWKWSQGWTTYDGYPDGQGISEIEAVYDLSTDPKEKTNLLPDRMDIRNKLRTWWNNWRNQMPDPLWGPGNDNN